jgi:hypothetical protein
MTVCLFKRCDAVSFRGRTIKPLVKKKVNWGRGYLPRSAFPARCQQREQLHRAQAELWGRDNTRCPNIKSVIDPLVFFFAKN